MTKCPGCGGVLEGLGTFCWTCQEYVTDMGTTSATPRPRAPDAIPDDREEDQIQEAGRKALELLGFTVYSLNQDRATRQTPGIADTYVAGHGRCTWAEWKRADDVQSDDQVCFEHTVTMHGAEYHVWRHENDAIAWARGVIEASR
ncbi:hypothetical protein LCGC14_3080650 [marine sediment metagenome]|uniref:VRR-NUC domain-containing protein n=1 Tax=marine sediment metagenome TaxID=412755 RepID=A0A0F8YKZ4_9ZZZZ